MRQKILIKSGKRNFLLLRAQSPIFCEALDSEIHITQIFFQHIKYPKNPRTSLELEKRLLLFPFISDVLKKGTIIETRKDDRFIYYEIHCIIDKLPISCVISKKPEGKSFTLLSCFLLRESPVLTFNGTPRSRRPELNHFNSITSNRDCQMPSDNINVKISRIDKSLPLPRFETRGSFGFDLLVREDREIAPGEIALIPGNIVVECPEEMALLILPRSSTYRKTGLSFPHSIGLIDQDYSGPEDEIKIQVKNNSLEKILVKRGDKIAQGLFVHSPKVSFEEIDRENISEKNSRGGFGSTDKKIDME